MNTDASFTDEQRAFVEAIRDFGARRCGSREQRMELTENGDLAHNQMIYEQLADLGWIGSCLPEAYGGEGGGIVEACLLSEETAYALVPVFGLGTTLVAAKAVEANGTEAQKQEILGDVCRGHVLSIAMSEPGAGSDVGSMTCRAVKTEGGWLVNGQKTWISNAQLADRILLVCRTDSSGSKHAGISMFDVPAKSAGVEVRPIETMGGREVNDVFFTDVFVADDQLVGREGGAWGQLMAGLNFERLLTAGWILGSARRAFDDVVAYVKERHQFGQPIGSFQVIKHRIADLATELECCRVLVYDVARRAAANPDVQLPREASMAKLKVTETFRRIALDGVQMMGGAGYATEYDMHRHVHAALPSTIYAGTSEIQREIISGTYGL